jgi:hypothetical protein
MAESGNWKHFNEFLHPERNSAAAARYWEQADPGTRKSVAGNISWKGLGNEGAGRFARLIEDEGSREVWLSACVQASFHTRELDTATILELIPSPARRGAIIRSLFPTTDFSSANPIRLNYPTSVETLRELIGRSGIPVPPPILPDPASDPFDNPE